MSTDEKMKIARQHVQKNLLVTTAREPERKIFVQSISNVGLIDYIDISHKERIALTEITAIRTPKRRTLLYPRSRTPKKSVKRRNRI